MPPFDWHSERITRATRITESYRNISEAGGGVWLAEGRGECGAAAKRSGRLVRDRNVAFPAGFQLLHVDQVVPHVLATHANDIGLPLPSTDEELKREPRIGPELLVLPVLLDPYRDRATSASSSMRI